MTTLMITKDSSTPEANVAISVELLARVTVSGGSSTSYQSVRMVQLPDIRLSVVKLDAAPQNATPKRGPSVDEIDPNGG